MLTAEDAGPEGERDYIQSLERGLAVIKAFSGEYRALSTSEIAQRTGMSRAACRRFLITLERLGYLAREGNEGLFRLQPSVLALGFAYLSSQEVREIAQPHLEMIAAMEKRAWASLGVLDGSSLVFISRVRPQGFLATKFDVGTRIPAHYAANGRVLLAARTEEEIDRYLDTVDLTPTSELASTDRAELKAKIMEAGRLGYSLTDQEVEVGVRSLAVPVLGANDRPIAGMSIGTFNTKIGLDETVDRFLPALKLGAARIHEALKMARR